MDIDHVVERLSRIPGAQVGSGPRHPRHPNHESSAQLDEFLIAHQSIRRDNSYVTFLNRYGGASIENEEAGQIVDILGFTDASTHLLEMPGPVVDENGFLLIAQCVYHVIEGGRLRDTQEHDFALDTTGTRKSGIYGLYSSLADRGDSFEWCAPDFLWWLNWLVDQNGVLSPPASRPTLNP